MNIEIVLNDREDQPVLRISKCHQSGLVSIGLINETASQVEVHIEDLRHALRTVALK